MTKTKILITSEHAGNDIPRNYRHLFREHEALLGTHRGFDLGVDSLAKSFATTLNVPMYKNSVSRLVVDTNRSLWRRTLFSEITKPLPKADRDTILNAYYHPHRDRIAQFIHQEIEAGRKILHVATHTFTPALNGSERQTDIGLLYDPDRSNEKHLCKLWKTAFHEYLPELRVRFNYPYRGKPDGLTAHFRKRHTNGHYLGIELEVNQKYVQKNGHFPNSLRNKIVAAFRKSLEKFQWS